MTLNQSSTQVGGLDGANINIVNSAWNETGLTWNNKPTNSTNINTTDLAPAEYTYFNLTNGIQDIINNVYTNYGFVIFGNPTPTGQSNYWSKEGAALSSKTPPTINISYSYIPILYTPSNGSAETKSYPPLTESINFTWWNNPNEDFNLVVSTDDDFNLIAVDIITSNNYSVQSLEAGNYWWKVCYYNTTLGVCGNWSDTFNFTLTNTVSSSGKGIDGIVYELIDGSYTPIDEATVYIYNTTWSSSQVTGTNGYYLFSNLANGTYNIYASKVYYDTTVVLPVTVNGSISTNNILMKQTEPTDFEASQQYVMFRTRWLWCFSNCNIEGITVTIYNSGSVTSYKSGVTDSLGIFKTKLFKSQLYRVTFINSSAGINQEGNYYGSNSEYVIFITNDEPNMQEHDTQEKDAITIGVSKTILSSTQANITINYTDSLSQTTALKYYINQSNTSDPVNDTNIASWTWAAGSYNHSFTVSNYSGQSYLVHIVGTHTEYGTIDRTYVVMFEKTAGVGIDNISNTLWLWFGIAIMFFTGAIFTSSTAEKGLLVICAEGWIMFNRGLFSSLDPLQFGICLTMASLIAVFAYFKKAQVSEGYT